MEGYLMKKFIALFLSFCLLFAILPANSFAANQEVLLLEKQKDIYRDGKIIGQSHKKITREFVNGITQLKTTEINKYNDGAVTEDVEVMTIEIVNKNEAKINGELIDLNQVVYDASEYDLDPFYQLMSSSGGLRNYTTYEDVGSSTTMESASGIKNRLTNGGAVFLDPGYAKDDKISRTTLTNGTNSLAVINFKHYADDVAAARATINVNAPLLAAALGVTVLTAASVIGALTGAITVASFAIAIWDAGSDANRSMGSAYAILQSL